jgi:hypothetical protein
MSYVFDSPNHYYATEPSVAQVDRDLEDLSDAQIARLAAGADPQLLATKKWENFRPEERREWRALEAHAKRQHQATLRAEQAAEAQRQADRQRALAEQQIADYKAQMRRAFLMHGTVEQFESAWPEMLRKWQTEQAEQQRDAVYELARARIGHAF